MRMYIGFNLINWLTFLKLFDNLFKLDLTDFNDKILYIN